MLVDHAFLRLLGRLRFDFCPFMCALRGLLFRTHALRCGLCGVAFKSVGWGRRFELVRRARRRIRSPGPLRARVAALAFGILQMIEQAAHRSAGRVIAET
jgi:hypothetical protein